MKEVLDRLYVGLIMTLQGLCEEERGDTNFISILIILGLVVILAGVFIGFKDQIVGQVQAIVGGFTIQ